MTSNNNFEEINRSYEETKRRITEKFSSEMKQTVDVMKEQQLKAFKDQIDQANQAIKNNDLFKAQYHFMNATFYRNLLGV